MTAVTALILHVDAGPDAGPLVRAVASARAAGAERHRQGFLAAGATSARIVAGPPDAMPFGTRLAALVRDDDAAGDAPRTGPGGIVVLGSGAIPLATVAGRRAFVAAAAGTVPAALTNNRYSADIIAVARARDALRGLPALATDNVLPRWLVETAGVPVQDLRRRWRLGVDIDGPLDLVLLGGRWVAHLDSADRALVVDRLAAVRTVARDPHRELLVAGRTSAPSLAWLERTTAGRVRALIEERGMRTSPVDQRPAASVLGALLERDGPATLGAHLARLADAALIDTRVLIAHQRGTDERAWPSPNDRAASDLLLADRIRDRWLAALTASARDATIPVVLGSHTLVGPGLRLALRSTAGAA